MVNILSSVQENLSPLIKYMITALQHEILLLLHETGYYIPVALPEVSAITDRWPSSWVVTSIEQRTMHVYEVMFCA